MIFRAVIFGNVLGWKFIIFLILIFIAKISKKRWFREAKMGPKIGFFELWRALVSDLNFSSFFLDVVALGLGTFVKDF